MIAKPLVAARLASASVTPSYGPFEFFVTPTRVLLSMIVGTEAEAAFDADALLAALADALLAARSSGGWNWKSSASARPWSASLSGERRSLGCASRPAHGDRQHVGHGFSRAG